LNQYWFLFLEEAKSKIEEWRKDYNQERSRSSLGNKTPEEFGASLEGAKTG
jgi:putative transposase